MPSELKPCPFCGYPAVLCKDREHDANVLYEVAYVKCQECGTRTRSFITDGYYGVTTTVQDAINTWNRRVKTDEIEKLQKELTLTRNYIHDNNLEWDLLAYSNKEEKNNERLGD